VKKLIGLISVIVLSMVLIGCGNDDHPLVGRWECTFSNFIDQYNADGTGSSYDREGELRGEFTWEIVYEDGYILTVLETIIGNGNTIKLTFEIDGNQKSYYMTLLPSVYGTRIRVD